MAEVYSQQTFTGERALFFAVTGGMNSIRR